MPTIGKIQCDVAGLDSPTQGLRATFSRREMSAVRLLPHRQHVGRVPGMRVSHIAGIESGAMTSPRIDPPISTFDFVPSGGAGPGEEIPAGNDLAIRIGRPAGAEVELPHE